MSTRALLVLAAVLGSMLLGMPQARAHAVLLETSPVDGAVVAAVPQAVGLRFSEAVSLTPESIRLFDAAGRELHAGRAAHLAGQAGAVTATVPASLPHGTYVVAWRVVSDDSHVVSGAFEFSVGEPSSDVSAPPQRDSRAAPVVSGLGSGLGFLGMALTIGGAVAVALLWPDGRPPRGGAAAVWAGFVALCLGTAAVVIAQYPLATGQAFTTAFSAAAVHATVTSQQGIALLVRLGIAAVLSGVFATLVRRDDGAGDPLPNRPAVSPGALALGAGCAFALTLTWTLWDHARTGPQPGLAIPVESVHLLAVSIWLGGLIALVACVAHRVDRVAPAAEQALARFSRLALPCFAAIVATGVYQSWRQVGAIAALGDTRFGRLLLVKLAGVSVILLVAVQSRRLVRRRGAGRLNRVRRLVVVEALLGAGVLGVTTLLADAVPARSSYAPPVRMTVRVPATAHTGTPLDGGHLDFRLTPARHGLNVADIYLVAPDGLLVPVDRVTARLQPARPGDPPMAVQIAEAEPGHYVAERLPIPAAGVWRLQVHIRTSDVDDLPLVLRFRAH